MRTSTYVIDTLLHGIHSINIFTFCPLLHYPYEFRGFVRIDMASIRKRVSLISKWFFLWKSLGFEFDPLAKFVFMSTVLLQLLLREDTIHDACKIAQTHLYWSQIVVVFLFMCAHITHFYLNTVQCTHRDRDDFHIALTHSDATNQKHSRHKLTFFSLSKFCSIFRPSFRCVHNSFIHLFILRTNLVCVVWLL